MEIRTLKPSEIELKVKQINETGCILLAYKTARVDMDILDEVYGEMNWESDYKEIKGNLYCGIGVHNENGVVWKWDCGIESREDGEGNEKKGEASDSFKRAGFKWGIGRELYTCPLIKIKCKTKKNDYNKWVLDGYQKFYVSDIDYDQNRKICYLSIENHNGENVFNFGKYSFNRCKNIVEKAKTIQELELIYKTIICNNFSKDSFEMEMIIKLIKDKKESIKNKGE